MGRASVDCGRDKHRIIAPIARVTCATKKGFAQMLSWTIRSMVSDGEGSLLHLVKIQTVITHSLNNLASFLCLRTGQSEVELEC